MIQMCQRIIREREQHKMTWTVRIREWLLRFVMHKYTSTRIYNTFVVIHKGISICFAFYLAGEKSKQSTKEKMHTRNNRSWIVENDSQMNTLCCPRSYLETSFLILMGNWLQPTPASTMCAGGMAHQLQPHPLCGNLSQAYNSWLHVLTLTSEVRACSNFPQ